MKRTFKTVAALLGVTALMVSVLTGCGGKKAGSETASTGSQPATEEIKPDAISTVGPDNGTKLELWTFVDVHCQHYAAMLEKWNAEHPDKQIQITFTVYPYGDMHNKLIMANQTGQGAPDICDVEIGS